MPPSKCLFLLLNLVVAYAASVEIVGDTLIMSDNAKHYYNGLERTNEQIRQIYSQWMVEHAKHHNTISENDHRFEIFKDNLRFIDAHNSKGHSYQLGLNKFADLTNEEYRSMYLGVNGREGRVRNGENKSNRYAVSAGESLPNNIDWRIKNGPPGHDDCGLCDEFIRPPCCNELENKKAVSIDSFEDVPANNEKALQKAVAHQVVRASIEAAGRAFQLYKSGIFTGQCGTTLDHKVVVEGYGTENGKDYWIVHNSWGPKWGESGYIRLERNIASPSGKCGIAMKSSYPVKKHRNPPKPAMENATH